MKHIRATKRLINAPKEDTIRLWSLQPIEVWNCLQRNGQLYVDSNHEKFADSMILKLAYQWMREEMARHIPDYQGHSPWWAYEHFLDLRFYRHHHFGETIHAVRLELAIEKAKVLLSGYSAWGYVLDRSYLPKAIDEWETEYDAWYAKLEAYRVSINMGVHPFAPFSYPEPFETEMRESWTNIFDVDLRRPTETIQAVFENLRLEDVVSVTEFISVGKYKNKT